MQETAPTPPSSRLWMFLVPSLIGLFLFMVPIRYEDSITIPVALLAKGLKALMSDYLIGVVTLIIALMSVLSLAVKLLQPQGLQRFPFIYNLLNPSWFWLSIRLLGGAAVVMTYFQFGPEAIWHDDTGGLVLNDLLPTLFSVFIFAGLLLPLLLNFGLLEFFGGLLSKVMRPLFNLPGRGAIDCMASWLGDGSVGILMTSKQYEQGFYTQREAVVVGTTFSAVSITFSLVVLAQVKLEYLFLPFYAAICLSGFAAAMIIPRLPPLRWKKDLYIDGSAPHPDAQVLPAGYNTWTWSLHLARQRAAQVHSVGSVFKDGVRNAVDMVFGVLPVVMGLGTIALILAEYTSLFSLLGQPFIPLLELLAIPEAAAASQTLVVGFADMFIPAILASSIESDMTRFIIAAVSVTQLIYMSEVGALLLGSRIPVNIVELFVIFILRTLITLPIIAGIAHLIF